MRFGPAGEEYLGNQFADGTLEESKLTIATSSHRGQHGNESPCIKIYGALGHGPISSTPGYRDDRVGHVADSGGR